MVIRHARLVGASPASSHVLIRSASASAWVVIEEKWVPGVAYTCIFSTTFLHAGSLRLRSAHLPRSVPFARDTAAVYR